MRIIGLVASNGRLKVMSRIGYGDFVYSFFSTISYHLEGINHWGEKLPRLMLDLCDHGIVAHEDLDELKEELHFAYSRLESLPFSSIIYDIQNIDKPLPMDLFPLEHINKLSEFWITPRGSENYLKVFDELISLAKGCNGSLSLIYAYESINADWKKREKKGRNYWLNP